MKSNMRTDIFNKLLSGEFEFWELAEQIWHYQMHTNLIFKEFVKISNQSFPSFLPIQMFKNYPIKSGAWDSSLVFESSGTTGVHTSKHYINDIDFYLEHSQSLFESNYGKISDMVILALLPHYLERQSSSLVAMVDHLIKDSDKDLSGFYLYNQEDLKSTLLTCKAQSKKTILFGVTFALLDFVNEFSISFPDLIIIETGGMKGKGRELPRFELHELLKDGFGVDQIHSEYGMTELLSQCYSFGNGIFQSSATMQVLTSEMNDPFAREKKGKAGMIDVVDLANIDTCSFIATEDIGVVYDNMSFTVLGRSDHSDLRGCNLLVGSL